MTQAADAVTLLLCYYKCTNADTPEEREDDEDTADIVARLSASVSIRQHPSASVSIQHTEERERYEDTDSRYCRTPARQYLSFCTSKASKLSTFLKRSPTGEALRVRRACTPSMLFSACGVGGGLVSALVTAAERR